MASRRFRRRACVNVTSVIRSTSGIVNGRSTSASNIEKIAALAPSPSASVSDDDGAHRRALQDAATGIPRFEAEGSHEGVSRRTRWQRGKIASGAPGSAFCRSARRYSARGQPTGLLPIPDSAHATARRTRAPRAPRANRRGWCRSTRRHRAPSPAVARRAGRRLVHGGHDSSLPSRPCQSRSRLRRDARIAARPAAVTVK